MKNTKLHEQYKVVTKDILQLIGLLHAQQKLKAIAIPRTTWKSIDSKIFWPSKETQPLWSVLVNQAEEQIKNLPAASSLLKTFEADDVLRPHINAQIGTSHWSTMFTDIDAICLIAVKMISETNNLEYSDALFEKIYENVERDLYSDQIVETRTVPLLGLSVDEELQIDSEISLIPLTDEDISGFLAAGVSIGMKLRDAVSNPARAGIKIKRSYRKHIGPSSFDPEELRADDDVFSGRVEREVVNTLRIYKPGRIVICGSRTVSDSIFAMGIQFNSGCVPQFGIEATYKLGKDEIVGLQDLYKQIMNASRDAQKGFLVAVRRFSLAGERTSAEDRIIDYLIAAEALFLTEEETQELSYRLAHRMACALGDSRSDKLELFKKVRKAYRVRSKLVHGKNAGLQHPGKDDAPVLEKFADELESLLRKSIMRKLDLAKAKHVLIDKLNWNDFLF